MWTDAVFSDWNSSLLWASLGCTGAGRIGHASLPEGMTLRNWSWRAGADGIENMHRNIPFWHG